MSPSVLSFFSSRFEMEEAVQSRFLAVAPAFARCGGRLGSGGAGGGAGASSHPLLTHDSEGALGCRSDVKTKARRKMSIAARVKS
jgi:hypothetical protein